LFLSVYCSSAWLVFIPLLYYTLLWYIVDLVVFFMFLGMAFYFSFKKTAHLAYQVTCRSCCVKMTSALNHLVIVW
jgi:hypothetical protein